MGVLLLLAGGRLSRFVLPAHPLAQPVWKTERATASFILRNSNQSVRALSLALCLPKFLHIPFLVQPPLLLQVGRSLCTVFCWLIFTQSSSLS